MRTLPTLTRGDRQIGEDDERPAAGEAVIERWSRAVTVRDLAEARMVLEAARQAGLGLVLLSAPDAGRQAGAAWWQRLVETIREEAEGHAVRGILDCGAAEGSVLAALRAGVGEVVFRRPGSSARALAAIAREVGAALHTERPQALDLGAHPQPRRALDGWIANTPEPS